MTAAPKQDQLRNLSGVPVYCSWSGGKDSAMALHEAMCRGAEPGLLLTMMAEGGQRSRSHGLSRELLTRQAEAMELPIRFAAASWDTYEDTFRAAVTHAVGTGFGTGVHGDIDIDSHRTWVETVSAEAGARAVLPLWHRSRRALMRDLLDRGVQAVIVAVRDGFLPASLLGRVIDAEVVGEIDRAGADPAGEHGEYHTVVTDGPSFRHPLWIDLGGTSLRNGVWFIDVL